MIKSEVYRQIILPIQCLAFSIATVIMLALGRIDDAIYMAIASCFLAVVVVIWNSLEMIDR